MPQSSKEILCTLFYHAIFTRSACVPNSNCLFYIILTFIDFFSNFLMNLSFYNVLFVSKDIQESNRFLRRGELPILLQISAFFQQSGLVI